MKNDIEKEFNEALDNAVDKINNDYKKEMKDLLKEIKNSIDGNKKADEKVTSEDIQNMTKIMDGAECCICVSNKGCFYKGRKYDIQTLMSMVMGDLINEGAMKKRDLDYMVEIATMSDEEQLSELFRQILDFVKEDK